MHDPVNVIVVGAGHYVLGRHDLASPNTDKDLGIILPFLSYLKSKRAISNIHLVARDGSKLSTIFNVWRSKISTNSGLDTRVELHPPENTMDNHCYKEKISSFANTRTVVFIATPDGLHAEIVKHALVANLPVFVVKPLVTDVASYNSIEMSLRESDHQSFVYIDYHKTFDQQNIVLSDRVSQNAYGDILLIESIQTQKRIMKDLYKSVIDSSSSFNVNHYLGSHYIHQTSYITKGIPRRVYAKGLSNKGVKQLSDFDMIKISVDWQLGERTFTSTHLSGWCDPTTQPFMTKQQYRVYGSDGFVESIQDYRGLSEWTQLQGAHIPNPHYFTFPFTDSLNQFRPDANYGLASIQYFLSLADLFFKNGISYQDISNHPNSFESSKNTTHILEAADLSLRTDSQVVDITL